MFVSLPYFPFYFILDLHALITSPGLERGSLQKVVYYMLEHNFSVTSFIAEEH